MIIYLNLRTMIVLYLVPYLNYWETKAVMTILNNYFVFLSENNMLLCI